MISVKRQIFNLLLIFRIGLRAGQKTAYNEANAYKQATTKRHNVYVLQPSCHAVYLRRRSDIGCLSDLAL